MLKPNMYVRCFTDLNEKYHRDYAIGQIISIDEIAEQVTVEFYDLENISSCYPVPVKHEYSVSAVCHWNIADESEAILHDTKCITKASELNSEDGYYYYYVQQADLTIQYVPETELHTSFTNGALKPWYQLCRYEFQNPVWFFGRSVVSKTAHYIDGSMYGFKELAGCKIFLKPFQLRTIMRCLKDDACRFMIADEVGLGKTIEAIGVLKVYLGDRENQKVLILTPESLIEQWKTELAFKFHLFTGLNQNNNWIDIQPLESMDSSILHTKYHFVIIDEVHRSLYDEIQYRLILRLSQSTQNILMLSATPIQKRAEEYQKLLTLIQPDKYATIPKDVFDKMLEQQGRIIRKVHDSLEDLDSYREVIQDNAEEHTDDTEEAYEELIDGMSDLCKLVADPALKKMLNETDYESDDFGVGNAQTAIAYVCEHFQLEKSIIRNRRSVLREDVENIRSLRSIEYDITSDCNFKEYQVYRVLCNWAESLNLSPETYRNGFGRIVAAFFSSAHALKYELSQSTVRPIPRELTRLVNDWLEEETQQCRTVETLLDNPDEFSSRMVNIIDTIDQSIDLKKILLFTSHPETFKLYQAALTKMYGDSCAFFSQNMTSDEREVNVYRFQNNRNCRILLSDETGGEGRNFQFADAIVHIDLPWNANTLEQRIGRLDRIGRVECKPVLSIVTYAKGTLEESLFSVWNKGLHIFDKSQTGLEIIMNDVDRQIVESVCKDFKYGLDAIVNELIVTIQKLEKEVQSERYFDVAPYQYQTINLRLEQDLNRFAKNETQLFSTAMMNWASLSGFNGTRTGENSVAFTTASFSLQSAINSMYIAPDMDGVINDKLNQLRNRIRLLNQQKQSVQDCHYIEGTFDREAALKNDYIHFFAPGDPVYDSIVNNSIRSYRGTCAAFAVPSTMDWTGLVFTYKLVLNNVKLYKAGIGIHQIDQYRGYLPSDQVVVAIPIEDTHHTEAEVLKVFESVMSKDVNQQRKLSHLGKRQKSNGVSPIQEFKSVYPIAQWRDILEEKQKLAKMAATEKYKKRVHVGKLQLQSEVQNDLSSQKAHILYYSIPQDMTELERRAKITMDILNSPRMVLDSVCFMKIYKGE